MRATRWLDVLRVGCESAHGPRGLRLEPLVGVEADHHHQDDEEHDDDEDLAACASTATSSRIAGVVRGARIVRGASIGDGLGESSCETRGTTRQEWGKWARPRGSSLAADAGEQRLLAQVVDIVCMMDERGAELFDGYVHHGLRGIGWGEAAGGGKSLPYGRCCGLGKLCTSGDGGRLGRGGGWLR